MDFSGPIDARSRFRFKLPRPVTYSVEDTMVEGMLCDISTGGAQIESKGECPKAGDRTVLHLQLSEELDPMDLEMEVTRETENGFAGRFLEVSAPLVFRLSKKIADAATSRLGQSKPKNHS